MYHIDLLKGYGVPIKSKPGGIYLIAFSFIVPVALTAVVAGNYLHNRILIKSHVNVIEKCEAKIEELAPRTALRRQIEQYKDSLLLCQDEAADVIPWHMQWSGILAELASSMPESMTLDKLEAKKGISAAKRVPSRRIENKMIEVSIPVTVLNMLFYVPAGNDADEMVKEYIQQLRYTSKLADKIKDILPVGSRTDETNNLIYYEFQFVFQID